MFEIAFEEFEKLKVDIADMYEAKGMRASGDFEQSLEVIQNQNRVELWANDYTEQLEYGRSAGKFPNIKDIEKWIVDKGVFSVALQNIKLSSLAFLIARKIANFGWKREQFGGVELVSSVLTENRIQDILDKIGTAQTILVLNQIEKIYDNL
jgi:hypothetical protein